MATGGCHVCDQMEKRQLPVEFVLVSTEDLLAEPDPQLSKKRNKILRKEKEEKFVKKLNALMNTGTGLLCLHVKNPHMLGLFDQCVNPVMTRLISDNTSFPENFERYLKDDQHVIFRVKQKARLLSTVSFQTKVACDKGVEDATHAQMRHFLTPKEKESAQATPTEVTYTFKKGKEVFVTARRADTEVAANVVFQESMNAQAKQIPLSPGDQPAEKTEKLIKVFFDEKKSSGTFLPKYFAAFSKLETGGSILLGVEEEKKKNEVKSTKWTEVSVAEREGLLTFKDPAMKLWKHEKGGTAEYTIAQKQPSDTVEEDTGKFLCQGFPLNAQEQGRLRQAVTQQAGEMTWHPGLYPEANALGSGSASFQPPVEVRFHEIEDGGADLVVPEVIVRHYKGMVFIGKEGPEAYYIQNGTFNVRRMTMQKWFKNYETQMNLCQNCKKPKEVESCKCGQ